MLERAVTLLVVSIVAMAGLAAGLWSPTAEAREAAEPLRYAPVQEAASGRTLLADDPETGRVVEVIGDLDGAEHVAVVVPGTGQNRGTSAPATGAPAPCRCRTGKRSTRRCASAPTGSPSSSGWATGRRRSRTPPPTGWSPRARAPTS
ncbi:alpha/beta hydrolase [Nocardiopsis composta]